MFKLRQRNCLLITIILVITPCILVLMRMGPELSTEQTLSQRLAECHMRLQYLESMYRARQEDVAILSQYLGVTQNTSGGGGGGGIVGGNNNGGNNGIDGIENVAKTPSNVEIGNMGDILETGLVNNKKCNSNNNNNNNSINNNIRNKNNSSIVINGINNAANLTVTYNNNNNNNNNNNTSNQIQFSTDKNSLMLNNLLDMLSPEARKLIRNATNTHSTHRLTSNANIRLPTAYHFLPHLLDNTDSLRPAYLKTKGRTDVSIVLGVPTVKREKQSYLYGTLQNLIDSMSDEEQNETLIIVFIAETELDIVNDIANQIIAAFEFYIDCGLIDIIAPSPSYYPNFNNLRITLNDPLERVKWRSKQNLDFAYLMAYAQSKGTFYVQLEDDILAKRNFITAMKKFAIMKSASTKPDQPPWFILDFCQLGFIGKMFKSAELPYMITFFQMFYNDKPVDWLLHYFIESKVCRTDKDQKHCNLEKAKYWLHYRPSLFQHIGTSSSLKGKVQKLKDKQFGFKVPTHFAHTNNPPAIVSSNIAPYKNYLLKRAYRGETYFWGLLPQPGDFVQFTFEKPIQLQRYLFRSGNSEHPSDRFYNTTVEVLTATDNDNNNNSNDNIYNTTTDGYIIIGAFDPIGVAEGIIDPKIGPIKQLRLHVHGDSENWALLSEINLQVMDNRNADNDVIMSPGPPFNENNKNKTPLSNR